MRALGLLPAGRLMQSAAAFRDSLLTAGFFARFCFFKCKTKAALVVLSPTYHDPLPRQPCGDGFTKPHCAALYLNQQDATLLQAGCQDSKLSLNSGDASPESTPNLKTLMHLFRKKELYAIPFYIPFKIHERFHAFTKHQVRNTLKLSISRQGGGCLIHPQAAQAVDNLRRHNVGDPLRSLCKTLTPWQAMVGSLYAVPNCFATINLPLLPPHRSPTPAGIVYKLNCLPWQNDGYYFTFMLKNIRIL